MVKQVAVGERLIVKQVKVRYQNGAIGIHDISLEARPHQVVALFGPNGAGKTTSVRAISGFLKSEGARVVAGTVTFGGRNITNAEPHQACRMGISVVPERQKIFRNLTVTENLAALGNAAKGKRKDELRDEVFSLFPMLAGRHRELAGRLSGGQQQMLAIGRALLSDPKVLIIDEMTLGIHQSLHESLFDAVRRIAEAGKSVLIVDESTGAALEVADYCYLIGSGTVRAEGTPEKFRGHELVIAGYVGA